MQFNSFQFLVFFPAVLAVYFVIPRKLRYLWLLAASYWFYLSWNVKYGLLLVLSTVITYCGALVIDGIRRKEESGNSAKRILAATLIANLLILAGFKYLNFLLQSVQDVLNLLSVRAKLPVFDILLPVGISFYIFQAIGYTVDVYRGKVMPERNILRYALFVSFFPQLVAGPIERSENLMPQLNNLEKIELWDFQRIQRGCLIMLYGFLMKMLIADRASVVVDYIYNNYQNFSGAAYLIATVLFSIQIYCDFGGYSYIAIGAAMIMGIRLMNNFDAPYLAVSIKDYWKRWHISLSSWFREYLYFPLGGNRHGKAKKCRNILIVNIVSGLWHGAAWNFVLWGLMHGVLLSFGELTQPVRKKILDRGILHRESWLYRLAAVVLTYLIILLTLVVFRSRSLGQIAVLFREIFAHPLDLTGLVTDAGLWFGMRKAEFAALGFFILLLFVSDLMRDKRVPFLSWFEQRSWPVRAGTFLLGILAVMLFGVYGPGYDAAAFIYFQF